MACPRGLEEDFIRAAHRLDIDDDLIDDVLDMVDYPVMDMAVDKHLSGDKRDEQFVILAFNKCVRDYGWPYEEKQLTFVGEREYFNNYMDDEW